MNFYISDLHLGHTNALKFDNRPFASIEEQDVVIIENINKTVSTQDALYLLGDVSWYKPEDTLELLKMINCENRYLVLGNHDRWVRNPACKKQFQAIYEYKMIQDGNREIFLCHYPVAVWNKSHRGSYHLYGHVHRNLAEDGMSDTHKILGHPEMSRAFNVGCMLSYMSYTPRTFEEILEAHNKH